MKTINNTRAIIEAGFEFVCDFTGNKLFKKLKPLGSSPKHAPYF